MQIEAVDFFYLALPDVRDIGDGSQDTLLVRVRAGDWTGWGECEASPLVSIASFVCPMSHSACHPLRDAVLGQPLDTPDDIRRITTAVRRQCFDLLQADHTLSGLDIALWDLLGQRFEQPVWRLLGYDRAWPKVAYASLLFGDTPDETARKAAGVRAAGFRAAKFGWGPYGLGSVADDAAHVTAARDGLGPEVRLLVDAGTVWGADVEAAAARLPALAAAGAGWLEEPFPGVEVDCYGALAARSEVPLAGGEGAHHPALARHLIDHGGLRYVQIDAGRIGGLTSALEVAQYAAARGVTYVNHTFTTPLALSASLQPYAGLATHDLCEYPVEASALATELTAGLPVDDDGCVRLPEGPGLGLTPDPTTIRRYLREVEIRVGDDVLYATPEV